MNAYWDVPTVTDGTYEKNLASIIDMLTKTHKLPLSGEDLAGITAVYRMFYGCGPSINYGVHTGSTTCGLSDFGNWADLMMSLDHSNTERSFLST
jgi:hypothetical protein